MKIIQSILLIVFHYWLVLASAAAISPQNFTNDFLSRPSLRYSPKILRSLTKLTQQRSQPPGLDTPPVIPGFTVSFEWDPSKQMFPPDVFFVTVSAIWHLSQQQWNERVDLSKSTITKTGPVGTTFVRFSDNQSTKLHPSHLVLALRQAFFIMDSRYGGPASFVAKLVLVNDVIGTMSMIMYPKPQLKSVKNKTETDSSFTLLPSPMTNLAATFGEFVDPEDPHYKVRWNFQGLEIYDSEFHTAIIDALATMAPQGHGRPFDEAIGYSVLESVVLSIVRNSGQTISYAVVMRALVSLVAKVIYARPSFTEMAFQIMHDNTEVVQAVIFRPKRPGIGNRVAGVATS
ncbi:MAG: hypothetical protein LQ337_003341 [Flavoplaca oasis]|nr:MAG: hypothetical protein LQ337_003341 [Flavoplaca oasis]